MAEWIDISTEITSGDTLTSSCMQVFRDNMYGLCDQTSGAPVHRSLAFCLGSTIESNSYAYNTTSDTYQTVCVAYVYIPYNANKITCGMSLWSANGDVARGRIKLGGETLNLSTTELSNSVYTGQIDISSFQSVGSYEEMELLIKVDSAGNGPAWTAGAAGIYDT